MTCREEGRPEQCLTETSSLIVSIAACWRHAALPLSRRVLSQTRSPSNHPPSSSLDLFPLSGVISTSSLGPRQVLEVFPSVLT